MKVHYQLKRYYEYKKISLLKILEVFSKYFNVRTIKYLDKFSNDLYFLYDIYVDIHYIPSKIHEIENKIQEQLEGTLTCLEVEVSSKESKKISVIEGITK